MSARAWRLIYQKYRGGFTEYIRRHRATRAPWFLRFVGILFPRIPARWIAEQNRRTKVDAKARYKKRVHEAKGDPSGFGKRYGSKEGDRA